MVVGEMMAPLNTIKIQALLLTLLMKQNWSDNPFKGIDVGYYSHQPWLILTAMAT
ncbi:MAG: hypothetical protein H0A76_00205 [Candidatus Thiodubiliella endoseptemdiera]|uniref:Uncharacterized protein n=1 Tax=Candidatus Thiodubiliella endoseptemdiera TaxID=2738886 RepID=A0A853F1F0_9GAMM|nr:hypothetical protein [Candidatus Thiodubiliella endoseptemdiera]